MPSPAKFDELCAKHYKKRNDLCRQYGMDKTVFRKDKAAVDAEIERMKRLVSMGGFIPCSRSSADARLQA